MQNGKMKTSLKNCTPVILGSLFASSVAFGAAAASINTVEQAVNIFESGPVTGGAPLTVDVGGPVAVADGVELPGFAFGTYDVDFTSDSVTMTFVNDPTQLGIAIYDSTTIDSYYFEFDRQIASADIVNATLGFAASVEIISAGSTATSVGSFVDGLPTSFSFGNGGILVTVGEGTNLNTVGTGGAFTVSLAAVPLPASLPLLLAGMAGLGMVRRRRARSA